PPEPPTARAHRRAQEGRETELAAVERHRSVLVGDGHADRAHVGDPGLALVAHLVLLGSSILRGDRRSCDMRLIGHLFILWPSAFVERGLNWQAKGSSP